MNQNGSFTAFNPDPDQGVKAAPTPRRDRLASLTDVRREMSRIYRDMKHGKRPSQDGSRLVFVLTSIAKLIEQSDLEKRLESLEGLLAQRKN